MKDRAPQQFVKAPQSRYIARSIENRLKAIIHGIPGRCCRMNIISGKPDKIYQQKDHGKAKIYLAFAFQIKPQTECNGNVPIAFGLWLYLKGERKVYLRFAMVFLLVNLIGFAGYYIHPAAPPWYAMNYGFEPVLNTPGNVAGLGRFDELLGCSVFHSIYGRNANVFAAVPSLHAAYMVVAVAYAIMGRCKKWLIALFSVIMAGIWWTAVYSGHHYLIDVMLGISCALLGILVFEQGLMKWGAFKRFFERYSRYIG